MQEKSKHKPKRKNRVRHYRALLLGIVAFVLMAVLLAFLGLRRLPVTLHITDVQSVTIRKNWTGFVQGAPYYSSYDLLMQNDMLVGTATYASGY